MECIKVQYKYTNESSYLMEIISFTLSVANGEILAKEIKCYKFDLESGELSVCMCVHICECNVCHNVNIYIYIMYVCMCVCVCVYMCMCVCLYVCIPTRLFEHLAI